MLAMSSGRLLIELKLRSSSTRLSSVHKNWGKAAALTTARAAKSPLARLATAATTVAVFASAAAAAALLALSSLNYPGGEALSHVARVAALAPAVATPAAAVHVDVLSCMTGVTLFGQNPAGRPVLLVPDGAGLRFDKTEDAARLKRPGFWLGFDYLLVEDPAVVAGGRWETLGVVEGFAGVEVLRPGGHDVEAAATPGPVVGRGRVVAAVRDAVRGVTGGWWVGPRMEPRVYILKRDKVGAVVVGT
ncbi:hypothetical protein BN1708_012729, partial [Verticillium longisporum]